jgi:hypothetical protein
MPSIKNNAEKFANSVEAQTIHPSLSPSVRTGTAPVMPTNLPQTSPYLRSPLPDNFANVADQERTFYSSAVPQTRIGPAPASAALGVNASSTSVVKAFIEGDSVTNNNTNNTTVNNLGPILKTNNVVNPVQVVLNLVGPGISAGSKGVVNINTVLDWVSVLSYDADPTGTRDSLTAITLAFNAAATAGVPLYFPAGTYQLSNAITASATPPAIIGDGSSSTIIENTGDDTTAMFVLALSCPMEMRGIKFLGTGDPVTYNSEIKLTGGGSLYDVIVSGSLAPVAMNLVSNFSVSTSWEVDNCKFDSFGLQQFGFGQTLSARITNTISTNGIGCNDLAQVIFENVTVGGVGVSVTSGIGIGGADYVSLVNCLILPGTNVSGEGGIAIDTRSAISVRNCRSDASANNGFYISSTRAEYVNCIATNCTNGFNLEQTSSLTEFGGVTLTNCRAEPTNGGVGFLFQYTPEDPDTSITCIGCTVLPNGTGCTSFQSTESTGAIILIGCMDTFLSGAFSVTGAKFLALGCSFLNAITGNVSGVQLPQDADNTHPNYLSSPTATNSIKLVNQTGGGTSSLLGSPHALYRVSAYFETTTTSAAGSLQAVVTWTDDNGSQSANLLATPLSFTSHNFQTGELIIKAVSGTVDVTTTLSGVTGSPQFSETVSAEQLV